MYCHSRDEGENSGRMVSRWVVNASHMIKTNNSVATSEMVLPIDETVFHSVYASG